MRKRNKDVLKPIKKTIYLVIALIILILISLAIYQQVAVYKQNEEKVLINIIGKQRMYTQMISKDANNLFALMQLNESNQDASYHQEIARRMDELKRELSNARNEFEKTLDSLNNGYIEITSNRIEVDVSITEAQDLLQRLAGGWGDFRSSVNQLIGSEQIDDEAIKAVRYINSNNLELLDMCDELLNILQVASVREAKGVVFITDAIVVILFVLIISALTQIWRFILKPYSQLYKGIEKIGLESFKVETKLPTKNKVMPIVSEISDMFKKIEYLITLIESMNNNVSTMEILKFMNQTFSSVIPYNYIGIALVDEERKNLKASYGVSDGSIVGLPERMMGSTWLISDTSLEKLLDSGEARIINDLEAHLKRGPIKQYNKIIMEAGIQSSITLPLKVSGIPVGMIFFSSNQKNVYRDEHLKFLKTLANSIAISLNQNLLISDVLYSGILALAKLAEARDEDTGDHLERMKQYSRLIAGLLYENGIYSEVVTLEYIEDMERFSPLHDIGKVGIRDGILLKPGKLTPEEFEEMKNHALFGAEVLCAAETNLMKKGISFFHLGIEIAEGHHEKWDGSGYPHGKKGEDIPVSARIVAIADVFDALTSRRPYKEPFPYDTCIEIIQEGRGKHFDPVIVDVFMNNQDRIKSLYNSFHLKS